MRKAKERAGALGRGTPRMAGRIATAESIWCGKDAGRDGWMGGSKTFGCWGLLSTGKRSQVGGAESIDRPGRIPRISGVEPGGEVLVVGAALCVELWRPDRWFPYVEEQMPGFRRLFDNLSS